MDLKEILKKEYGFYWEVINRIDHLYRWAMQNGWIITQDGAFYHPHDDISASDLELYTLYQQSQTKSE